MMCILDQLLANEFKRNHYQHYCGKDIEKWWRKCTDVGGTPYSYIKTRKDKEQATECLLDHDGRAIRFCFGPPENLLLKALDSVESISEFDLFIRVMEKISNAEKEQCWESFANSGSFHEVIYKATISCDRQVITSSLQLCFLLYR